MNTFFFSLKPKPVSWIIHFSYFINIRDINGLYAFVNVKYFDNIKSYFLIWWLFIACWFWCLHPNSCQCGILISKCSFLQQTLSKLKCCLILNLTPCQITHDSWWREQGLERSRASKIWYCSRRWQLTHISKKKKKFQRCPKKNCKLFRPKYMLYLFLET